MKQQLNMRRSGFLLVEAMVALLIIAFGLVALSRLQVLSVTGSGDAKARSEAMAFSQRKLEALRNMVEKSKFTGTPMVTGSGTESGQYASYALAWTVSTPSGGLEQRLLQLNTTWTDSQGVSRRIDLNSVIAWDDPSLQAAASKGIGGSLISPTGAAQRIDKTIQGHTGVYTDGENNTYLLDSAGKALLYIPPKNGEAQAFTTITGKIFFDQNAGNKVPSSTNVRVRLSSEGECVYNNAAASLIAVTSGSNSYKYFVYKCYVGPGWYGNVGVLVDESVNGAAGDPNVCVGDPGFNGGVSNSTLISAHPVESATRSYRGFKGSSGVYLSTGVRGETQYGKSYADDGTALTGPFSGRPLPSAYADYAGVSTANDYFEQNFLLTSLSGNDNCNSKMAGGVFTRNAGKYFCINPDNDAAADVCPTIWPGFESQVGTGGSVNYTLTVATSGTGTVTSSPTGISCPSTCMASYGSGTTVTLTAAAGTGYVFSSWSGCSTSSGDVCTVTLTAATTVTATFVAASSSAVLTIAKAGTGIGTVSSSPAGISCGATCSATVSAGTVLTAVADGASTFTGWSGGGCSGTGSCIVTLNGATTVTATFQLNASSYALTVSKSGTGTGTVTSSPAGISCGASCSAIYAGSTVVGLTASPTAGASFTGWTGACTGTGACSVTMDAAKSVTAQFALSANCNTIVSGALKAKTDSITSSGGGNCTLDTSAGNKNFSCTISLPSGSNFTLTDTDVPNGNASAQYSYTKSFTANCGTQTGVTFP